MTSKKTSSESGKKGEQETLNAIIRFHHCEINHFKVKFKKAKTAKMAPTALNT